MGKIYLSQSFEVLAQCLAAHLEGPPLQKQWICVPSQSLKQWLSVQLALLRKNQVLAGYKICSLEEVLFSADCPNSIEMFCLIYDALKKEWDPQLTSFLAAGEKRNIELSSHLSALFFTYGRFGKELFEKKGNWQSDLLQFLFVEGNFRLPVQVLPGKPLKDPLHCFGFDFLPEVFWESLAQIPSLTLYHFSPCLHFWEDLCTKWEKRKLPDRKRKVIESYLADAPPLLSNWGKLGRKTLEKLDRFEMEEVYASLEEGDSLLESLRKEILLFTEPSPRMADQSIRVYLTGSSRMNEVEAIQEEIFRLSEEIPFSEMAILAPDIQPYVPLIEYLFSDSQRPIPYRFTEVERGWQSPFFQGLRRLIALIKENWRSEEIVELIETPSFYHKRGWEREKVVQFVAWTEEFMSTDWKEGLEKALLRLTTFFPEPHRKEISFGQADDLEEFLALFESLSSALVPLRTARMRLTDWASTWESLAEKYLAHNEEDSAAWGEFSGLLRDLREADIRLGGVPFPFEVIEHFLSRPAKSSIHGSHLHAVRIGSIEPGSILPVKALFLIGMDEENFPRKKGRSSLDLLQKTSTYVPSSAEIDRYLFLQVLFAAKNYLRISYGHLSAEDGKPKAASLLLEELFDVLGAETSQAISEEKKERDADLVLTRCFSICSPGPLAFEPKRTVSIEDLSLFASNPWKFYLRKELGIYLEDRTEPTFALQRAKIVREALKWPLEKVLSLPPGIFGEAFRLDVEDRVFEQREMLEGKSLFSIFFLHTASKQKSSDRMEMPILELELEDRSIVRIVGEAKHASFSGAIYFGDDKLPGLLKKWPEILAISVALETKEVFFAKNGKTKVIEDPKKSLKAFLSYYFRCLGRLSPLLPDGADSFLRKGIEELQLKKEYEDPIADWVFARLQPASLREWGWLKEVFADLTALYPVRGKHETV